MKTTYVIYFVIVVAILGSVETVFSYFKFGFSPVSHSLVRIADALEQIVENQK
jgi:hypothetical protein